MPTDSPLIAFECGECYGRGNRRTPGGKPGTEIISDCAPCEGTGRIRISLDDLAERIAERIMRDDEPPHPSTA